MSSQQQTDHGHDDHNHTHAEISEPDRPGYYEIMEPAFSDHRKLIVLENTETVHNLIVCPLCSSYRRPVLGLPPDWYKLKPYRARAVSEPRAVLAEFGTHIPDDVEERVSDAAAL